MEKSYQVQVEAYSGPLDLLLQLIEKEKLAISEISLAKVTDQFLAYLENRDQVPLSELSSFLSVAAKLLLIKSRSLLPSLTFSETEEQSLEDLQRQLELYAMFQKTAKDIGDILKQGMSFAVRDRSIGLTGGYYPPHTISPQILRDALLDLLLHGEKEVEVLPTETLKNIVSLEERIADIQVMIAQKGKMLFQDLLQGKAEKEEKIVSFLALLELVRLKFVFVEQTSHFAEIEIQKN